MKNQTFKTWCNQFITEESPIGDLARDNSVDHTFPDSYSYKEIKEYLINQHASDLCILSFRKAWKLYKSTMR